MSPIANSSDEYWSITDDSNNEVSLHQFGWSVATVGGSRYDLPPRRGDNIKFAYRSGQVHRNKLADQRVINLVMWLTGVDPATGNPTDDCLLQWNDSWDFLRRLLWKADGSQVALTRRWNLTVSAVPTLVVATALAEMSSQMTPRMTGRTRADFVLDFVLADPFFYGPEVSTVLVKNVASAISNPGHDIAAFYGVELDFVGPLTNPRVTNATPTPDVYVQYTGVIAGGDTVRLNVSDFTATRLSDGANVIGDISHSGARYWMGLQKASNLLTLTASAGAGTGLFSYRPPYV